MADFYTGLELNERSVRLCVYNKKTRDADTVMIRNGGSSAESPARMTRLKTDGSWRMGIEADYFAANRGCALFDDILSHCENGTAYSDGARQYGCEMVLGELIRCALGFAGIKDPVKEVSSLVLTVPEVTRTIAKNVSAAFSYVGFAREQARLQGYDESFFAHTYFQRPEVSSRDVGLFCFKDGGEIQYSRLHLDKRTRPSIVTVSDNAYDVMPDDPLDKDIMFEGFIRDNTSGRDFSSFFLVGDGFDRRWAVKSLALLSKSNRKVFYGNNLFAKGACFAAYERKHSDKLRGKLFLGKNLVRKNIGIEMMVDGADAYYPLITAGANWFETRGGCDLILNGTNRLIFRLSRLEDGGRVKYEMPLKGLPERPDKATRLRMSLEFESADRCAVTVSDLGFGEMYPSSGLVWNDVI